jgi:hypothetical protein
MESFGIFSGPLVCFGVVWHIFSRLGPGGGHSTNRVRPTEQKIPGSNPARV